MFRLFVFFLVSLLAMSIMLICFMPLLYAFCIFSFHCLSTGFLSLPLHMERGHMELGHGFPSASKKKGRGCEHVNISQAVMFSRFRGLASPIWLYTLLNPLHSSPFSLLDGLHYVYHAMYHMSSSLKYGDPCLLSYTYILGHALGI